MDVVVVNAYLQNKKQIVKNDARQDFYVHFILTEFSLLSDLNSSSFEDWA